MPSKVINITPEQVPMLSDGCKEFYATGAIPGELNLESWINHWQYAIEAGHGFVWAVVDEDSGEALAALGGYIGTDQSNALDLVFTERFFFSRHASRGVGLKLIQQAERDMLDHGVDRIYMIHLANHEPEKAAKLYTYLGYAPSEVLWVKEV